MENNKFKCDDCGRFIAPKYVELKSFTPDSYLTIENIKYTHKGCIKKHSK